MLGHRCLLAQLCGLLLLLLDDLTLLLGVLLCPSLCIIEVLSPAVLELELDLCHRYVGFQPADQDNGLHAADPARCTITVGLCRLLNGLYHGLLLHVTRTNIQLYAVLGTVPVCGKQHAHVELADHPLVRLTAERISVHRDMNEAANVLADMFLCQDMRVDDRLQHARYGTHGHLCRSYRSVRVGSLAEDNRVDPGNAFKHAAVELKRGQYVKEYLTHPAPELMHGHIGKVGLTYGVHTGVVPDPGFKEPAVGHLLVVLFAAVVTTYGHVRQHVHVDPVPGVHRHRKGVDVFEP